MAVTFKKIEKWASKNRSKKLLKATSLPNPKLRAAAANALGNVDVDEEIINVLIALLRDSDVSVRLASTKALAKVGNQRSIEFIRYLIENDDDLVKEAAIDAMNSIKERVDQEEELV